MIQIGIPETLSEYAQHHGRVGRDGRPAYTVIFVPKSFFASPKPPVGVQKGKGRIKDKPGIQPEVAQGSSVGEELMQKTQEDREAEGVEGVQEMASQPGEIDSRAPGRTDLMKLIFQRKRAVDSVTKSRQTATKRKRRRTMKTTTLRASTSPIQTKRTSHSLEAVGPQQHLQVRRSSASLSRQWGSTP